MTPQQQSRLVNPSIIPDLRTEVETPYLWVLYQTHPFILFIRHEEFFHKPKPCLLLAAFWLGIGRIVVPIGVNVPSVPLHPLCAGNGSNIWIILNIWIIHRQHVLLGDLESFAFLGSRFFEWEHQNHQQNQQSIKHLTPLLLVESVESGWGHKRQWRSLPVPYSSTILHPPGIGQ